MVSELRTEEGITKFDTILRTDPLNKMRRTRRRTPRIVVEDRNLGL